MHRIYYQIGPNGLFVPGDIKRSKHLQQNESGVNLGNFLKFYKGAFTNDVSTQGGRGVSEMLTKPDMGGGGVRPMMTSAKKDILLQLQQIHKQEYLTFELLDLNLFCPT